MLIDQVGADAPAVVLVFCCGLRSWNGDAQTMLALLQVAKGNFLWRHVAAGTPVGACVIRRRDGYLNDLALDLFGLSPDARAGIEVPEVSAVVTPGRELAE